MPFSVTLLIIVVAFLKCHIQLKKVGFLFYRKINFVVVQIDCKTAPFFARSLSFHFLFPLPFQDRASKLARKPPIFGLMAKEGAVLQSIVQKNYAQVQSILLNI